MFDGLTGASSANCPCLTSLRSNVVRSGPDPLSGDGQCCAVGVGRSGSRMNHLPSDWRTSQLVLPVFRVEVTIDDQIVVNDWTDTNWHVWPWGTSEQLIYIPICPDDLKWLFGLFLSWLLMGIGHFHSHQSHINLRFFCRTMSLQRYFPNANVLRWPVIVIGSHMTLSLMNLYYFKIRQQLMNHKSRLLSHCDTIFRHHLSFADEWWLALIQGRERS
jgi:hypothetical protein